MELVMWIVLGIVAVLGFIVLVPVLVVGTWYVIITVIMGLADGAIWLLDEGLRTLRGRKGRAEVQLAPPLGVGAAKGVYAEVTGDSIKREQQLLREYVPACNPRVG